MVHVPEHAPLDVAEEEPRLRGDEREDEDRVLERVLVEALRVRVLQVVEEPEQLQEDLGRLLALDGIGDAPDHRRHRGVLDAVVDGLELLVDEEGEEVAPPDLAVEDLPHRGEGRVGQPRELDEVHEHDVDVLEATP